MTEYIYPGVFLIVLATFGYRFLAYISKHSIALYCTRGKGSSDENRIRVFLQNLEDVPLSGDYRLRVRFNSRHAVRNNVVRAGPRFLREDASLLEDGIWDVYFTNLPPHDTWVFELDAPYVNVRVDIFVQPIRASMGADKADEESDPRLDFAQGDVFHIRRLPKLTTEFLSLPQALPWALAGSEPTPRWGLTIRVMGLALLGYLVAFMLLAPSECASGSSYLQAVLCRSGQAGKLMTFADVYFAVGLIIATISCRWAGRRQPIPIAKGYLERTKVEPYIVRRGTAPGGPQSGGAERAPVPESPAAPTQNQTMEAVDSDPSVITEKEPS